MQGPFNADVPKCFEQSCSKTAETIGCNSLHLPTTSRFKAFHKSNFSYALAISLTVATWAIGGNGNSVSVGWYINGLLSNETSHKFWTVVLLQNSDVRSVQNLFILRLKDVVCLFMRRAALQSIHFYQYSKSFWNLSYSTLLTVESIRFPAKSLQ